MNVCIFVLLTVSVNEDERPRAFPSWLPAAELNWSYVSELCVLRFKTRVVAESLLFIYLSIHFILSVPQERTAVFLYPSAKSDAVRGAERKLHLWYPHVSRVFTRHIRCCLFIVCGALLFLLADGDSIDIASGCLSHTSFASQLN